jgi:hypothetical protein
MAVRWHSPVFGVGTVYVRDREAGRLQGCDPGRFGVVARDAFDFLPESQAAARALGVTPAEFEGAASRARMLSAVYTGAEIICAARALTGPIGDAASRAMVQAAMDSGTTPFGPI